MIIESTVKTKGLTLTGRPYILDTMADSLYINVRPGTSVYSEFRTAGGDLFLVDLDRDGNLIGVTIDNFLEKTARLGLKTWFNILWLRLLETFLPLGAWTFALQKYAVRVVAHALSDKRMRLDLLPHALAS